jgi:MFS transporter, FSR family, fosmidomycin resistance protein
VSTQAAPATEAPEGAVAEQEPTEFERRLVLWLTNASHALNHFQNQMVTVLYPVIMADLGFGYAQLGAMAAVRNLLGSATQGMYGFLAPFMKRSSLLGIGNFGIAIGTVMSGLVGNFTGFLVARCIASAGSSAQHPVGSSLLAGYFPKNRGMILALNSSIASVGGLLAPAIAGLLLIVLGWREIFFAVAILSVAMGIVYFLLADRMGTAGQVSSKKGKLKQGWASYARVLRNRNILMISLVMMVGAAGRGEGVSTFLGPHLYNDLALSLAVVGIALTVMQVGNIFGPIIFGWLSDRLSRKGVLQASLLLSSAATWWLAYQGAFLPMLLLSLVTFGAVTGSRNTLTQALVADSLTDEDRDAAFSVYYFIGFISEPAWALLGGFLMQGYGFEIAFSRLAISYLIGVVLVFFVVDPRDTPQPAR